MPEAQQPVAGQWRTAQEAPIQQTLTALFVAALLSAFPLLFVIITHYQGFPITERPDVIVYVLVGCFVLIPVQGCGIMLRQWKERFVQDDDRLSNTGRAFYWMLGFLYLVMVGCCVSVSGGTERSPFSIFYPVLVTITLSGAVRRSHGWIMLALCSIAATVTIRTPSPEQDGIMETAFFQSTHWGMSIYAMLMAVLADSWRSRHPNSQTPIPTGTSEATTG